MHPPTPAAGYGITQFKTKVTALGLKPWPYRRRHTISVSAIGALEVSEGGR